MMRETLFILKALISEEVRNALPPGRSLHSLQTYASAIAPDSSYYVRDAGLGRKLAKDEDDALDLVRRREEELASGEKRKVQAKSHVAVDKRTAAPMYRAQGTRSDAMTVRPQRA